MHRGAIPVILALWNTALSFAVLLILVVDRITGPGTSARSSLDYPVWLVTLVYTFTVPIASIAGIWLARRSKQGLVRIAHLGFFLLWVVLLAGTFFVR